MPNRPLDDPLSDSIVDLTEAERDRAMRRFEAICPYVLHGVGLTQSAQLSGVPVRTL